MTASRAATARRVASNRRTFSTATAMSSASCANSDESRSLSSGGGAGVRSARKPRQAPSSEMRRTETSSSSSPPGPLAPMETPRLPADRREVSHSARQAWSASPMGVTPSARATRQVALAAPAMPMKASLAPNMVRADATADLEAIAGGHAGVEARRDLDQLAQLGQIGLLRPLRLLEPAARRPQRHHLTDRLGQLAAVELLLGVVVAGARLHEVDGDLLVPVAGQDDHRGGADVLLQVRQELERRHLGQEVVEQDAGEAPALDLRQRLLRVGALGQRVACASRRQGAAHGDAIGLVVVDEQDARQIVR